MAAPIVANAPEGLLDRRRGAGPRARSIPRRRDRGLQPGGGDRGRGRPTHRPAGGRLPRARSGAAVARSAVAARSGGALDRPGSGARSHTASVPRAVPGRRRRRHHGRHSRGVRRARSSGGRCAGGRGGRLCATSGDRALRPFNLRLERPLPSAASKPIRGGPMRIQVKGRGSATRRTRSFGLASGEEARRRWRDRSRRWPSCDDRAPGGAQPGDRGLAGRRGHAAPEGRHAAGARALDATWAHVDQPRCGGLGPSGEEAPGQAALAP